jgi:hypothetical protein
VHTLISPIFSYKLDSVATPGHPEPLLFARLESITDPNAEIIEVEMCTSAPPTKSFFARYFPKSLSATNRSQNSMFASNHTIASQHTQIKHWKSPEDMEFGELPRSAHNERRNEIHKTVESSQSWFNDLSTGASPPMVSREQ